MKATGIVRRIDDLGRVVIPKEIRRTMRIREGDPLEIFTDRDGEVIFNEINTMPGFTDISMYPRLLAAAGLPIGEVLDTLLASALRAYDSRL